MVSVSKILPTSHISFINPLDVEFHLNESLNSIEAINLNKLGISFVKSIIDLMLISRLPNCILATFFLINQAKSSMKVYKYSFPP